MELSLFLQGFGPKQKNWSFDLMMAPEEKLRYQQSSKDIPILPEEDINFNTKFNGNLSSSCWDFSV